MPDSKDEALGGGTLKGGRPGDVLSFLSQRKLVLLQILVICFAIIVLCLLLVWFNNGKRAVEDQISGVRDKLSVIETLNQVTNKKQEYLSKLKPSLDDDNIIGYLTDLSNQRQVDIISFSPGSQQVAEYHETSQVEIVCAVKNFKDLVLFLRDIENGKYSLRVNGIQVSRAQGAGGVRASIQVLSVKVRLKS